MATVVVDLCDRRPIWSLPEWAKDRIRAAAPADWSVTFMETDADGSGDGMLRAPPELVRAVARARVYMGYGIPADVLRAGNRLEWLHSAAAGVGSSLGPEMLASDAIFTNSAGIHGPPIAETAMAMILHFARGLDLAARAQRELRWGAPQFWAADAPVTEVSGSVVGIVGFGGIGREVARRAACLGSRVLAVRRKAGRGRDLSQAQGARDAGVEVVAGDQGLSRVMRESDFIVLAVPETDETRGMIDRRRLFSAKPGSVLVNVARGKILDEEALLDALDSGPIRAAALDVFSTEPLPPDHPFYRHPRVLMTPHVSATTRRFWERETALIADNLGRFGRGEPLRNQVDKRAGY